MRLSAAKQFIPYLILAVFSIPLFRDTLAQGQDFEVIWAAARALWRGESPYDLNIFGGMVFKYPPWVLILLFPFGALPLITAKALWAALGLGSLFYCIRKLLRDWKVSAISVSITLCLFWGIWAVHFLDGQIELLMLALVLWSYKKLPWLAATVLMTKIALAIPFVLARLTKKNLLGLARVLGGCSVGAVVLWAALLKTGPVEMSKQWYLAASSGSSYLSHGKTMSRDNQGFPAFIQRHFSKGSEALGLLLSVIFCSWSVWFLRKQLGGESGLAILLALGTCFHPLAWFHLFVFSFPLCLLLVERSVFSRHKIGWKIAAIACVLAQTVVTRKTMGAFGEVLELYSVKAWGALMGAVLLASSVVFEKIDEIPKKRSVGV